MKENIWQWWNVWFRYQLYCNRFTQCLINIRTRDHYINKWMLWISYNDTRKDNFWLNSARETLQVCDRVPAIMSAVVPIPLIHNIHRDLFTYIRVCTMHLHKPNDFHQLPSPWAGWNKNPWLTSMVSYHYKLVLGSWVGPLIGMDKNHEHLPRNEC